MSQVLFTVCANILDLSNFLRGFGNGKSCSIAHEKYHQIRGYNLIFTKSTDLAYLLEEIPYAYP